MITKLSQNKKLLTVLDQAVFSGKNFFITIIVARLCSIEEFGKFSLVFMLLLFGLDTYRSFVVQAMMANYQKFEAQKYLTGNLILSGFIFFGLGWLFFIFMMLFGKQFQLQGDFAVIMTYFVTRMLADLGRSYFFTYSDPIKSLFCDVCCAVVIFGLFGYFFLNQTDQVLHYTQALQYLSVGYAIGFGLCLLIARPALSFNMEMIRTNLSFGLWLFFTGILRWFNGNYIVFVASSGLGNVVAGAIRAIGNLFGPINVLLQAIENYVPVRATNILEQDGAEAMFDYINAQIRLCFLLFLPIFLTLFFAAKKILYVVFGFEYIEYSTLIHYIVIAYMLGLVCRYYNIALRTLNYTKPIFYGYVITASISLSIAYFLVNEFGILGYGIGIILFKIIIICFLYLSIRKYLKTL
ncbi:MAG: oligosaccharide flippase family protein [Myxococcota bacterium]|nr:oligosaccharide flippase family protein [Myxococcota bacterium]